MPVVRLNHRPARWGLDEMRLYRVYPGNGEEMNRKPVSERTLDDIKERTAQALGRRIFCALVHPDCPILILDHEASQLARHIAVRLTRMEGADE